MKSTTYIGPAILLLHVLIVIAFHLIGYSGHYGYDDMNYARHAHDLLSGQIDWSDQFSYRWTVIASTAAAYALLGISDTASSLPTMVVSIGILLMMYRMLRQRPWTEIFLALTLTTLSHWWLFYSDKLMPDMHVAFGVTAALYVYHRFRFGRGSLRPLLHGLLFSLALYYGFLSKGTVVLILPCLLVLFITDLIQGRAKSFWSSAVLSTVALFLIYLGITWYMTGDAMARLSAITQNAYLNRCSYAEQPVAILIERLTIGLWQQFMSAGVMLAVGLFIAGIGCYRPSNLIRAEDGRHYFALTTILFLLAAAFMSISLSSYSPMCLDIRHYLFVLPVMSIAAARPLSDALRRQRPLWPFVVLLALVALWSSVEDEVLFTRLYLPMSGLLLLLATFKKIPVKAAVLLFFLVHLIDPLLMVLASRRVDYPAQRALIQRYVAGDLADSTHVLLDPVGIRLADYYRGFEDNGVVLLDYKQEMPEGIDEGEVILIDNYHTRFMAGIASEELNFFEREGKKRGALLEEVRHIGAKVYQVIPSSRSAIRDGKVIFSSRMDFEQLNSYWSDVASTLRSSSESTVGRYSEMGEFSSTFSLPRDSVLGQEGLIHLGFRATVKTPSTTTSRLVLTIGDEQRRLVYEVKMIDPLLPAYGQWRKVEMSFQVDIVSLGPEDVITAYIWDPEDGELLVDDLEVDIVELKE